MIIDNRPGPAKEEIEMEKVTFTSALLYNVTSKNYYLEHDSTKPRYVGAPEVAIDEAWESLLKGQYLVVAEEEVSQLENPVEIQDHYFIEYETSHI